MAQLTWRNVDAPNFNGAVDGYRAFSQLLGDGLGALSGGLKAYDADLTKGASQKFMMDAMKLRTPEEVNAALASGTLTADPRRVNADAINFVNNQVGKLNDDMSGQLKNTEGAYTFGRSVRDNAARDDARGFAAQLAVAANSQDGQAVSKLLSSNPGILGNLPYGEASKLVTNAQGIDQGAGTTAQARLGTNNVFRNDNADKEAEAFMNDLTRSSGGNPAFAQGAIERRQASSSPLPPEVLSRVLARAGAAYAPGVTSMGGALAAAAGGAPAAGATAGGTGTFARAAGTAGHGTGAGSAWDRTNGDRATPAPISSMTLGAVNDLGNDFLKSGSKSTAMGGFQFTNATREDFGQKVFGKDWRTVVNSPENQEKLAKAVFEQDKGKDLSNRWEVLKNIKDGTKPGQFQDMSWEQFRNVITPGESGGTVGGGQPGPQPAETRANTAQMNALLTGAATGGLGEARMQQNTAGIGQDYLEALKTSNLRKDEVVSKMRETPGFKNTDVGYIGRQLEMVKDQLRAAKIPGLEISDSVAAAVLQRSLDGSDKGTLGRASRFFDVTDRNPNMGSGYRINRDRVKSAVDELKTPDVLKRALTNQQMDLVGQEITQSATALQQAQQAYQAEAMAAIGQPLRRQNLDQLRMNVQLAQQANQAALAKQQATIEFNAKRANPVGTSTPADKTVQPGFQERAKSNWNSLPSLSDFLD